MVRALACLLASDRSDQASGSQVTTRTRIRQLYLRTWYYGNRVSSRSNCGHQSMGIVSNPNRTRLVSCLIREARRFHIHRAAFCVVREDTLIESVWWGRVFQFWRMNDAMLSWQITGWCRSIGCSLSFGRLFLFCLRKGGLDITFLSYHISTILFQPFSKML